MTAHGGHCGFVGAPNGYDGYWAEQMVVDFATRMPGERLEAREMVFPVGDDNTGRVRTPYVTYALIAVNVLVFVLFQGMGTNEQFTYAFATVPQEIRTGDDVARPVPVQVGDESGTIPLQPTPGSRLFDVAHVHVHAWKPDAPARQHAVPVDLRRQHRGRDWDTADIWVSIS